MISESRLIRSGLKNGNKVFLTEDPAVIRQILEHLGLWAPRAMQRSPPLGPKAWPVHGPACSSPVAESLGNGIRVTARARAWANCSLLESSLRHRIRDTRIFPSRLKLKRGLRDAVVWRYMPESRTCPLQLSRAGCRNTCENRIIGRVVELVYTRHLKCLGASHAGSTPVSPTIWIRSLTNWTARPTVVRLRH